MNTISFKISEEQEAFLRRKAAAERRSISDILRGAVTAIMPKKKQQGCRVVMEPGRSIIYHPPGTPQITQADLDAEEEEYLLRGT